MIPLDSYPKWAPVLDERARRYLNSQELQAYLAIPPERRQSQLKAMLEAPIASFTAVNEVYFRARWAEALTTLYPDGDLKLLEIASGDADCIPQAMERSHPHGSYVSANMNQALTRGLLQRTAGLSLPVRVIEDDAAALATYLPPASLGVIAFQHGVNDVIQAILCDREGVDTIHTDWMETLPKMIAILQREMAQDTLASHARQPFMSLVETLAQRLKPGGKMVMNHYMFQLDLDWGYPPSLFDDLIPIVRSWLTGFPGCREVFYPGFDPHWWLFLERKN